MPRAKSLLKRLLSTLHLEPFASTRPVVIAALCLAAGVLLVLGAARTQMAVHATVARADSVRVGGPLTVALSQEIGPSFSAQLQPELSGRWEAHRGLLGVTSLTFTPSGHFEPDRSYSLRLTGLKRALTGARIPDVRSSFTTQAPSQVESITPAESASNIAISTAIRVTLTAPNQGVRDLRGSLDPAIPLKLSSSDDVHFTFTPATPLGQGVLYKFKLDDYRLSGNARHLRTVSFATVAEPRITGARTGPYFAPGQTVDITFDQPMKPTTTEFAFDTPGKSGWADDHTFRFTPSTLHPGEVHNYLVKAGLESKAGGVLEANHPFTFWTTGAIGASLSPGGGGIGLGAVITVAFDQPVDHASAQAHFGMSPGLPGSFSWSGNTMTYHPSGLSYQTTYSYSVSPGVTPSWGLPNAVALTGSFSTVLQTVLLPVPFIKQPYPMSCELTSLRMVLAFYGINTSELDIVGRVGYSPRARDFSTNTWDNPNVMFVGDLNGAMDKTGYGVYSGPIAKAAQSYGRSASAYTGVSPQWIAQQVYAGHPVIFWGHSTPAAEDDWNTPQGPIRAYISAHARVVYGVTGSASNPTTFYINDPMGSRLQWSPDQLSANMNVIPGVSNQAVLVW